MRNDKPVLGMIDCPHCGEVEGMAVKHDKNMEPFGHCEECAGQLRVGGKPARVRKFVRRYPWAAAGAVAAAPAVTGARVQVAPVTGDPAPDVPVTVTVTEPEPKPAPRRASFMDALASLNTLGKVGVPA
jgi:hypothetical protein